MEKLKLNGGEAAEPMTLRGRKHEASLVREPDAGNHTSGSMSGSWERDHGRTIWAPSDERNGNRDARPKVSAPHLDATLGIVGYKVQEV